MQPTLTNNNNNNNNNNIVGTIICSYYYSFLSSDPHQFLVELLQFSLLPCNPFLCLHLKFHLLHSTNGPLLMLKQTKMRK